MIGLVGCCGEKLLHAAPAVQLYRSPLFLKASAYASRQYDRWFILSALYGLVEPSAVIAPYDVTLPRCDEPWGLKVFSQLAALKLSGETFSVHAGSRYVEPLRGLLSLVEPLKGLGIGQRLAWYAGK